MDSRNLLPFIFLLIYLIPYILFILTLQNTLKVILPENRRMSPGNVWLIIIPLFGFIWQFIVVSKIADSIKAECIRLNILIETNRPTYTIGLIYCISCVLFLIPLLKLIGSFAVILTMILYWIKVNEYKKLLIANKDNYLLDAEKEIFHT